MSDYVDTDICMPSAGQCSRLRNGHCVVIKSGSGFKIPLRFDQRKLLDRAGKKLKGVTVQLDKYQQDKVRELSGGRVPRIDVIMKTLNKIGSSKAVKAIFKSKIVKKLGDLAEKSIDNAASQQGGALYGSGDSIEGGKLNKGFIKAMSTLRKHFPLKAALNMVGNYYGSPVPLGDTVVPLLNRKGGALYGSALF